MFVDFVSVCGCCCEAVVALRLGFLASGRRGNQKTNDDREKAVSKASRNIKALKLALIEWKKIFGFSRLFKVITVEDHYLFQIDVNIGVH